MLSLWYVSWLTLIYGHKIIFIHIFAYTHYIIIHMCAAAAAKSLQSCPTLCDPTDGSPPGSPVPGILQARTLEWVAIAFSNAGKWKVKVKSLSPARLLATPWTAAHQAAPSMGFSRQEYWSGVPLPSPICTLKQYRFIFTAFELYINGRLETFQHMLHSLNNNPLFNDSVYEALP